MSTGFPKGKYAETCLRCGITFYSLNCPNCGVLETKDMDNLTRSELILELKRVLEENNRLRNTR